MTSPSHSSASQPMGDAPSAGKNGSQREMWAGLDQANVMSLELLSGILVWGGGGWLLDRWIGSTPWFFAIGVLLGFAGGLYLVWVRTGGVRGPSPTGPDDDGRVRDKQ